MVRGVLAAVRARLGALAARIGPRLQMSTGSVVIAAGLALFTRISLPGTTSPRSFPRS
jgi:hypothetical protein